MGRSARSVGLTVINAGDVLGLDTHCCLGLGTASQLDVPSSISRIARRLLPSMWSISRESGASRMPWSARGAGRGLVDYLPDDENDTALHRAVVKLPRHRLGVG